MSAGSPTVAEWRELAGERLDAGVFGYIDGAAGDEVTLAANRRAFDAITLVPRVLRGGQAVRSTAAVILGEQHRMPFMVAPMAYQGAWHPEGEAAMARGAAAAGCGICLSSLTTTSIPDVAAAAPDVPRWFQLYPLSDEGMNREVIAQAADCGFSHLVITVDVPVFGWRDRDRRSGFALPPHLRLHAVPVPPDRTEPLTPADVDAYWNTNMTWDDIARWAEGPLPLLVKGILAPEDAVLAADHGARGVIVSNHGGRQLDTTPAAVTALPGVVDAVRDRIEVLIDSGIRRGTDVVKALALGASGALVGRPVAFALGAGGPDGVTAVLTRLRDEVDNALALVGCRDPGDVGPTYLGA